MVTTQPSNQTSSVGGSTTFTVAANGSSLTYQWQRLPAGTTTWVTLTDGGAYSGTATATLTVNPVAAAMNGDSFRCVVSNASGQDTSAVVVLTVSNSVAITAGPSNLTVAAGFSARFAVTATGAGTLTYQWQRQAAATSHVGQPGRWRQLPRHRHRLAHRESRHRGHVRRRFSGAS